MEQGLAELFTLSRYYGSDPRFVLAGGGNTSLKLGGLLYVKASGTSLAEASEATFVAIDRERLAALWERSYSQDPERREAEVLADLMAARVPGATQRPSVETLLHGLLPQRLVVHTHPALINGITCARDGERAARELFGDTALWVEAGEPGYLLALRMRELMESWQRERGAPPDIVLIQNHGLLVAGEDSAEVRARTQRVMEAVAARVAREPQEGDASFDRERVALLAPALRMMLKGGEETSILRFCADREVARRVASEETFAVFREPFTPDHMVYCGRSPLFVRAEQDLEAQYSRCADAIDRYRAGRVAGPRIVAIEGLGVFAWGPTKREADTALALFRDAVAIACYAESFGGAVPMPEPIVRFIEGWEVERYRRRVAEGAGRAGGGRQAERIAVVTGGAQGFGLGLAQRLVEEGAHVAIADVNESEARTRASEASARGPGSALAVRADVTDERSVWRAVAETVLEYGGLDLMVSNAGVLKAGDLESLDPQAFEAVWRVNYTGYYLCARAAARIMKIQRRFAPEWSADIVQINSKSGLVGSKKNFAYAGSKFGGIGLTQSLALELVDYGIKVNAICPGNFFDGPLWSDPEKGLFVQYLAAGKVPGARTVEDVRRHYESLVPMGRGCTVEDVFRALLYAVEQQYETGQAIPVTGGQVMLA